jgi:hypothetical protein
MTNESIYQIWRPANSPWSQWVKPVIFPFLSQQDLDPAEYPVQHWQTPLQPDTTIIADLPGAEGILAGIALARAGYLPVLVYNACPAGTYGGASLKFAAPGNANPVSPPVVVDMSAILSAICATTKELASIGLPAQAPPVFLLDGNRAGRGVGYGPGWFDNRSFVTPSDFPTAEYFHRQGVSKVVLLQPTRRIKPDLLQVLLRLQRDGMTIAIQSPWERWEPSPLIVKPPMFIISAWEWLRRTLGYSRDPLHGYFGEVIPPSSS